jgi:hypothetical protein
VKPPAIAELSPIRPLHSRASLLFPVQSVGQAISLALIFAGVAALAFGAVSLTEGHASPWMVLPTLAGGLPSLYFALPGAFEVRTRAEARHWLPDIEEILRFLGYRIQTVERPGQAWRYRLNHPRWLRWRENEIELRLTGERQIDIRGPKMALRLLRKHLVRKAGG